MNVVVACLSGNELLQSISSTSALVSTWMGDHL